jgi:hypothetical protein
MPPKFSVVQIGYKTNSPGFFHFIKWRKLVRLLSLLVLFWHIPFTILQAQLQGKITDAKGDPLAYATVYIEGTTRGTTSNMEGYYSLKLDEGEYNLLFRYVGFEPQTKKVLIDGSREFQLDVQMDFEAVNLDEVVVRSNVEDPAYRIIREAIKKRKFFLSQVKSYKAKAYVKGLIKMFDAPEKFMGMDIGNMEGILDTNRQGILYLSESESIVYYKYPNQYREEMISSIVSGDDRGFSFNQATAVDFNFYKNTERFGRKLISPIASSAFQFYKFKLVSASLDQKGRLVNKIQVIPKRETDPVYFGFVYITEDIWNFQQVDLSFTSKSVNQNFFDTIGIKQVFVPEEKAEAWHLFSQILSFNAEMFRFKFGGSFTYIYSDYEINPDISESLFTGELMKVEEGANERDSLYWQEIRPVPLTVEESFDYIRKDSLQDLWESKPYLDSIDRKENKFKFINLLFGYSYNQSFKHRYFQYNSPLGSFQFNPVQGPVLSADFGYRQEYDEERKYFSIQTKLQYGFSDNVFRPSFEFNWKPENIYDSSVQFGFGKELRQLNQKSPVWKNLNTWTSLFGKNNLLKLFDREFIELGYQREIWNGVEFQVKFKYENRQALSNNSNYSFFKKEDLYAPNLPEHSYFDEQNFRDHKALVFELKANFGFKQRYISYPKQRFRIGSKYPKLRVTYQRGLSSLAGDADFDKLILNIYDRRVEMGRLGFLSFQGEIGFMLRKEDLPFIDYFHFLGNELHLTGLRNHGEGFLKMPNYHYSTDGIYGSIIFEQHFEGLIMDRIPVLKHWSWETVFGARYLYENEGKRYTEFSIGIDQISLGPVRIFRFDYVWSLNNGNLIDHGPVFSVSRVISDILD